MINFQNEKIKFHLKHKKELKQWLTLAIETKQKTAGNIQFVFCDDEYLLKLNIKYLNHTTFTDIITFDYSDKKIIAGDIFISIERVKENALKYSLSFEDELHRVLIHGVLHLLGYTDKTKTAKVKMTKEEDKFLLKLKRIFEK